MKCSRIDGVFVVFFSFCFFFQAEDGIRDLVRSRGLGDVYKRQAELRRRLSSQNRLLGSSAAMKHVVEQIGRVGPALSLIHI